MPLKKQYLQPPQRLLKKKYYIVNAEKKTVEEISGRDRKYDKIEYVDSFFSLFDGVNLPVDDVFDEEWKEQINRQINRYYDTANTIRDEIIPRAWFRSGVVRDEAAVVRSLKTLQDKHIKLENELQELKLKLKRDHEESCNELYAKRGKYTKHVFSFWLDALWANDDLAEHIQENRDFPVLQYLSDIKCVKTPKSFRLEFQFENNPYFTNHLLTITYYLVDGVEHTLRDVAGTQINWKQGKAVTTKIVEKVKKPKQKKKSKIRKAVWCQSFFHIFDPFPVKWRDEHQKELRLEDAYDIGAAIRDDVIPYAFIRYQTTAAANQNTML